MVGATDSSFESPTTILSTFEAFSFFFYLSALKDPVGGNKKPLVTQRMGSRMHLQKGHILSYAS